MSDVYFIDFETYSEKPIKFGSFRYAQDKSTEVICMAYSLNREEIKLWHPDLPPPIEFLNHIKSGGLVRSFNATFEYAILKYVCSRIYQWPVVTINQMRDTMSDVLALSLPGSLDGCAKALGLSEQKDNRGKLLITQLSKPRKPTKNKPYTRLTRSISPELFKEFYDYCVQDVRTEIAIFNKIPRHIKGDEQKIFEATLEINENGLPIDIDLVRAIIEKKAIYEEGLNSEIFKITKGRMINTNSRPQSLEWLKDNGAVLDGYTKNDVSGALKNKKLKKDVRRFLEIRAELSRTPIKKFDFIINAICDDNTIKNNLIYHKATTGRFSGSGFQIQNLPRDASNDAEKLVSRFLSPDDFGGSVNNEAIKLIRSVIKSPEGYKLIVSDFSSIENRVLAWLAGDEETLEDFRNGIDQYKRAASSIYGVAYEDVTKDQRQLGKISVLSCGFGGGAKAFKLICEASWGINISDKQSKDIVDGYREKYSKIVSMWRNLNNAAMLSLSGKPVVTYGLIKFRFFDDFLFMRLPSGRLISYYKPEIRKIKTPWGELKNAITHMGTNTYTRKWERLSITPGRLTENVTQAVARDFLTYSMLQVNKNEKYKMHATVHDEIITTSKSGSIEEFNDLMISKPNWGLDMPLEAEGFEGKRYKK